MPAQNVVGMFDGADDEDVPAHAWKRTAEDSPPTARRKTGGLPEDFGRVGSQFSGVEAERFGDRLARF
jgi:hypothetical protein